MTNYQTRLEEFRKREGLTSADWAKAAGMSRAMFYRYRWGHTIPHLSSLIRLTSAASSLLARRVGPNEVFDLGDDEPVGTISRPRLRRGGSWVIHFETPLDRFLRRMELPPVLFARQAKISPQGFLRIRSGRSEPNALTINTIVRTARRLGYDVTADALFDLPGRLNVPERFRIDGKPPTG